MNSPSTCDTTKNDTLKVFALLLLARRCFSIYGRKFAPHYQKNNDIFNPASPLNSIVRRRLGQPICLLMRTKGTRRASFHLTHSAPKHHSIVFHIYCRTIYVVLAHPTATAAWVRNWFSPAVSLIGTNKCTLLYFKISNQSMCTASRFSARLSIILCECF